MHFWIDKRSPQCYTGRHRVPTSLSSGVGRGRGRVYGTGPGVRKTVQGPHRFDGPPRRPRPRHASAPAAPVPVPAVHARRVPDGPSLYVEIPPSPPQPTIASLAAARQVTPDTLLRTAALGLHHHSPMMAPHLKFGMMVSFALATLFLAGAKYYFDRQVQVREHTAGSEAGVVVAAAAALCGAGCALARCRRPPPPRTPDRVSSTAVHHHTQQVPPSPSDDISLSTALQPRSPPPPPEAPPPYHIAVLLPSRHGEPPAYSALS